MPGARAAVLVDAEGETVDYAGEGDPFSLRVLAAQWKIVLDAAGRAPVFSGVEWFAVRAKRQSFLVAALPEAYGLVVALARAAGFGGWGRALDACRRSLAREAGWPPPPSRGGVGLRWLAVEVACDERRRPRAVRIAGAERRVDILGAVVSPPAPSPARGGGTARPRERAWRIRFEGGLEATLVREAGGIWYIDEAFDPIANVAGANVAGRGGPARGATARVAAAPGGAAEAGCESESGAASSRAPRSSRVSAKKGAHKSARKSAGKSVKR